MGPGSSIDNAVAEERADRRPRPVAELAAEGLKALLKDETTVIPMAGTYKIWATRSNVELALHPAPSMDNVALARKR